MAEYGKLTPNDLTIRAVGPEDATTATNNGTYISLANYGLCEIHIFTGDVAGNTSAITITQAQDQAGTGAKALSFTKFYRPGQQLLITGQSGTFSVGETITGGSSGNTAKLMIISSKHLWLAIITGSTTWTDGETLTGGTSDATALASGTGQFEDVPLEETAAANTFTTLALTFLHYVIPISSDMLDVDNAFDSLRVNLAQAGGATLMHAEYQLKDGKYKRYPQTSAQGTIKGV